MYNVKFKNCTLLDCTFEYAKLEDVIIEGGIKSNCNFLNIEPLNNVIGFEDSNIISEENNELFIDKFKFYDKTETFDYSDPEELTNQFNNVKLIITKESEEYGENVWRIMLLINNENILSETFDGNLQKSKIYDQLVAFYLDANDKINSLGKEYFKELHYLDKLFTFLF